jgi:hypothetical protein
LFLRAVLLPISISREFAVIVPELLERIQDTGISRAISESTWGYPMVGAIHVLAMALFGGAVLITNVQELGFAFRSPAFSRLTEEVRLLKIFGLSLVIGTGALLFASGAVRYYSSGSFRIKMVLLGLILLNAIMASKRGHNRALHSGIALALWAAVIFAARGIAFF